MFRLLVDLVMKTFSFRFYQWISLWLAISGRHGRSQFHDENFWKGNDKLFLNFQFVWQIALVSFKQRLFHPKQIQILLSHFLLFLRIAERIWKEYIIEWKWKYLKDICEYSYSHSQSKHFFVSSFCRRELSDLRDMKQIRIRKLKDFPSSPLVTNSLNS